MGLVGVLVVCRYVLSAASVPKLPRSMLQSRCPPWREVRECTQEELAAWESLKALLSMPFSKRTWACFCLLPGCMYACSSLCCMTWLNAVVIMHSKLDITVYCAGQIE